MKAGKKYRAFQKKVDRRSTYPLEEAIKLVKDNAFAKFDETLELTMRLGVDPKKADQMVRGTVVLPHGTGKKVRVLAFAKGEKVKEAQEAGADYVGLEDLIEKINGGWFDFDVAVATPDVMAMIGKLGKTLGTRGLMPNPKSGTVSVDIGKAIGDIKKGKIAYRVDRAGNVHTIVGKVSFSHAQIKDNAMTLIDSIVRARPSTAKGQYMKNAAISSTMGVGVKLDMAALLAALKA